MWNVKHCNGRHLKNMCIVTTITNKQFGNTLLYTLLTNVLHLITHYICVFSENKFSIWIRISCCFHNPALTILKSATENNFYCFIKITIFQNKNATDDNYCLKCAYMYDILTLSIQHWYTCILQPLGWCLSWKTRDPRG